MSSTGQVIDWLPVVGGPRDGCEFLPCFDIYPNMIVRVGGEWSWQHNCGPNWKHHGNYRLNATCTKVVWHPA